MSIDANIQKVAIVSLPTQAIKAMDQVGYETQLIRVTETDGSTFIIDSLRSTYSNRGFAIDTKNLADHYSRLRLLNITLSYNEPNVNIRNNNIRIFYEENGGPTKGVIDVNLPVGYYTDYANHLLAFLNSTLSLLIPVGTWSGPITFTRASTDPVSPDFKKMRANFPTVQSGNTYSFQFDANCSFVKKGKSFCYFNPEVKTVSGGVLKSGPAHLIATRFLYIVSKEMTHRQRVSSFDGEDDRRGIVGIINFGASLTQAEYTVLSNSLNYNIKVTRNPLGYMNFTIEDEHRDVINFGYDSTGNMFDNQLMITFNMHD